MVDTGSRPILAEGSSDGCPDGPLRGGSACDTDGLTCRYVWESTEHQECFCRRNTAGEQTWSCTEWHNRELCPLEPLEDGSGCYGSFGLDCWYPPSLECSCRSNTEAWECPRPEVKELTDPPELPNPERPVADLTEEERDAWCDWYARIEGDPPPGYAPPEERPIEGEYTSGVACLFNRGFCEFAIPKLSKAQCMANLSLSECESPIANLTGCAIDMFSNDCGPFDYSCFDYMAAPNCEGTIVGEVPTAFPSCDVRVQ